MPPLPNFYTKRHGNTKFDMRVGVYQIFLQKLVLSDEAIIVTSRSHFRKMTSF